MIDDIEDGKINCVVTKDLSRLGRNYILTGQYTEIYFPSKGVRYIAINDNVDTINGESELAPFLNILNEMHARQTSKKVKAAMHTRFANGAHYGAYAPPVSYTHLDVYKRQLSNQIARKQENSILRSIGLTQKQLCKMNICEGLFYAPVSYTHLDVYKRQEQCALFR